MFDLDGTLVDTADDLGAALNYVLTKHGLPTVAAAFTSTVWPRMAPKGLLELGFGPALHDFPFTTRFAMSCWSIISNI
ncbi:MAG: hypothetical protein U5L02_10300 [Rheinheimera sp.]|nr:hypothetical protein [Rheinheimera sp.]